MTSLSDVDTKFLQFILGLKGVIMKHIKLLIIILLSSLTFIQIHAATEPNDSCTDSGSFHLIDAGDTDSGWEYDYIQRNANDYYRVVLSSASQIRVRVEERSSGSRWTRVRVYTDSCASKIYDQDQHDHDASGTLSAGTYYIRVTRSYNVGINYRIRVNVTPSNVPPTANAGSDQTITLGDSITIAGSGSDSDGTVVSYAWTEGGTLLSSSTSFSYTPTTIGSHTLTLTVTDNLGATGSDTVTITVLEPERPPIMNSIPTQTIPINSIGNTVNLGAFVTTTNGDPILSYTLSGTLPSGMSFNSTTGVISGTPTTLGDSTLTVYATDNDGDSNTVTFTISIVPAVTVTDGYSDFALRFQRTLPGKLLTVGNTILVAPTNQSTNCNSYTNASYLSDNSDNDSNAQFKFCAYWTDTSAGFANTRAQLPIAATGTEIVWAGLYWQSIVPNGTSLSNMQIKLKHEASTSYTASPYQTVNYTSLNYREDGGKTGYTSYSAYADVTSYFRDNNLTNGYVTVGDIPTYEGQIDNLGTYGAWTLVVIYKDDTEPLQNFSIFDGWQKVSSSSPSVDVDVSGFYTPKQPVGQPPITITSSASVFAAEGDKYIENDYLKAKASKRASYTTLTHTSGQTFNSAIETSTSFNRTPNPVNNNGIDIQEFNIGTSGYDLLDPEENSISFEFSSDQDTYWPSMIAFATELYVPDICYDYTVRIGDYVRIPSDDRDISTRVFNDLPINIQFALRSEEADFVYFDTKARVVFSGTDASRLSYNRDYVQMSPPSINTYFKISDGYDEIETNASIGQIAVGADVIGVIPNNGGKISPNETTYAILGYDISGTDDVNTHFDLIFDSKIQFDIGATPVEYQFNTSVSSGNNAFIPRCPTNQIYDPVYMRFNAERVATQLEPLSTRYTLHTQVTGRPYQLDITSYLDDNASAGAHTPENFNGTVEVELIDAGGFQNSSAAGYDTVCEEPRAIGEGSLVSFNSANTESRHTIDVPADIPNYDDTVALKEAAIRLWIVAVPEANGARRIIPHQCTDKTNSDGCFTTTYTTDIDVNATGSCTSECSGTNSACYDCLKTYYAFPVCSRDNFAIRPASYHIAISDDGDDGSGSTPILVGDNKASTSNNNLRLAAEYNYILEINATNHLSESIAQRYYAYEFSPGNYATLPTPILNSGDLAAIEFNDALACYDQNSTTLGISFLHGSLAQATTLNFHNAGDYKLWLVDSNWTAVDQASSNIKPVFDNTPVDDCQVNSAVNTINEVAGCAIYSIQTADKLVLNLNFQPYQFNVGVGLTTTPTGDYLFLNDLTHTYYDDTILHPVDMGAVFDGNITAQGKLGGTLTNYTDGCAATDVRLNANITSASGSVLPLQLYLSSVAGSIKTETTLGVQTDLTLAQAAFEDNNDQGIAKIKLYSTLKKPLKTFSNTSPEVNPSVITYRDLNASGDSATSSADLITITPSGGTSYDKNITFVYGKLAPEKRLYNDVIETFKTTKLYVDIYCDGFGVTCSDYNLTTAMPALAQGESSAWYLADMFNSATIGNTTLKVTTYSGIDADPYVATPLIAKAKTINNVPFNSPSIAKQEDINVSVVGAGRPSIVKIKYDPVPWLDYDVKLDTATNKNNDSDYYRVKFIGERGWAGVGSTGQVVDSTSSSDTRPRMNW